MFGANYIKGKVRAQPNGNWVGEAKFKLHFKEGGAIDFGQAMLKSSQMASRNGTSPNAPPAYAPPAGAWYPAPPPAYTPPPAGYYGWTPPTNVFPDQPPGEITAAPKDEKLKRICSEVANFSSMMQPPGKLAELNILLGDLREQNFKRREG